MKIDISLLESFKRATDGSMFFKKVSVKNQISRKERQLKNRQKKYSEWNKSLLSMGAHHRAQLLQKCWK